MRIIVSTLLMSLWLTVSSVFAETWFTLAEYNALKTRDAAVAELVLKAMRETVFYAQESLGGPVICASPVPVSGKSISEMLDAEIESPTNNRRRAYRDEDQVAFVLMHALRKQGACK